MHNENGQKENEIILMIFSKESLICGKWTILGAKKTRGRNSGLVLRISFYFYIKREIKRHMKVMPMFFQKSYGGGKNGRAVMIPDGYPSCWFDL